MSKATDLAEVIEAACKRPSGRADFGQCVVIPLAAAKEIATALRRVRKEKPIIRGATPE